MDKAVRLFSYGLLSFAFAALIGIQGSGKTGGFRNVTSLLATATAIVGVCQIGAGLIETQKKNP
jgi:hypothetical protein